MLHLKRVKNLLLDCGDPFVSLFRAGGFKVPLLVVQTDDVKLEAAVSVVAVTAGSP